MSNTELGTKFTHVNKNQIRQNLLNHECYFELYLGINRTIRGICIYIYI